ncbi:MFS transporter [Thermosediminibacter litoriperuensis]|uniref:Putative MFS family arabinose efflux permease n=1 Tax=Thermosediminibacter litoriperuensis TaxID=291989 RepID=A0A5S5AIL8_9FIRM|nr:MFS transporter [Thermosediminibacter litoriperuensis]TYP49791.1 putative MFS family arabinose efflux permease [Thermosediminibacter litoriperuensis]
MNRRNYFLMCAIVFLQGFVFYGPIATVYRQARGLSMYDIFLIESISLVLMIVLEIPWGWFADRFGYKSTLVISNFLFLLSKIIFYKADSFELFSLERIILALSISGILGCDIALLYDSIDKEQSEKYFGRYEAAAMLGFFLASMVSTAVVGVSMDMAALLTIFPYAIAWVLTLFLQETGSRTENKPVLLFSLKSAFRDLRMLLLVIAAALVTQVNHSATVFLNQVQYMKSGIDPKYFGIIMAGIQLLPVFSAKTYAITGKLGQGMAMKLLFGAIPVSCFILSRTSHPAVSVVFIAVIGASYSLSRPILLDIQNRSITTADRATLLSIYSMIINIIGAVLNPAVGRAADISIETAFTVCGIIATVAFILIYAYFRSGECG